VRRVLLLVALAMVSVAIAAQVNTSVAPVVSHATEELHVLKVQLATIQDYQDQFVSMVQWSLGAVLAMALGLAAFNWYSSKASYERDIASLRQENKALHAELTAMIKAEADASAKRLVEALSERQKEIQAAVAKSLDPKLQKHSSDIADLISDVLELQYERIKQNAEEAAKNERYAWAIYEYCDLLDLSVKNHSDHYQVGDILDEIQKLLGNPKTLLSADDVTHATESLKRLPQRYQAAAQNLIPKISWAHK
jgi:hypothetical protein